MPTALRRVLTPTGHDLEHAFRFYCLGPKAPPRTNWPAIMLKPVPLREPESGCRRSGCGWRPGKYTGRV
jgi:hypothetical protein